MLFSDNFTIATNISELLLTKEEECSNIKTTNQGGTNQCTRKDFLYREKNIGKEMVQNETENFKLKATR